jgi:hypothetical protein
VPLGLVSLPLEGGSLWAGAIPIVERYAGSIRDWVRSRGSAGGLRRLFAALLEDPEVRDLLHVHAYGGITWFDRDGYRMLGHGLVVAGLLGSRSKAITARAGELLAAVTRAEDRSAYRVERLVGAGPVAAVRKAPSVPDGTGDDSPLTAG